MSGRQQLVGFLGLVLILANLVTNRSTLTGRDKIVSLVTTPNLSADQVGAGRKQVLGLVGEVAGLVVLVILAGAGPGTSNIALIFTVGLAIVWAMTYYAPGAIPTSNPLASPHAQTPFTKGS